MTSFTLFLILSGDLPDRHVAPIALVFDELKDYLSESDLSLDYKIARSRSKKKKVYRNSRVFGTATTEFNHQGIETDSKKLGLDQNLTTNKNLQFLSYHHKIYLKGPPYELSFS